MIQNRIRNFVILSHVDHGKSTLADRFLELTNTIPKEKMREQFLDMMDLERERGITIKMQPCRMDYIFNLKPSTRAELGAGLVPYRNEVSGAGSYILNLIDTPGHVDFSYEVSRSLAAAEGAILLVDASKGIQAQTISNLELAQKQNLVIIPAVNKIDLPQAKIEETKREISDLLKIDSLKIFEISAKQGNNVEQVLEAVISLIPPPTGTETGSLRALIFDSKYDAYKGVIAFVRVFDGKIKQGARIFLIQSKTQGEAKEIGFFKPELTPVEELKAGEIGYIATGVKEPGKVRVGDTITIFGSEVEPLPGYQEPKSMVFLSIYPEEPDDFELLKEALEKLRLNDAALIFKPELKEGLGRGFQCGFLGLLHAEIIAERLKREFGSAPRQGFDSGGLDLVLSTPSVIYKVLTADGQELLLYTSSDWPENSQIKSSQELWAKVEVLTPLNYLGAVLKLFKNIESEHIKTDYLGAEKVELVYKVPLREIIAENFYDKLKSVSQGFASMNYGTIGWNKSDLVKLDILIAGRKEEALASIVPEKKAYQEGKKIVEKLKKVLPSQLFAVPLQAAVGGKIIARETISAKRKDVIAPLYGGDYTRKRKLLEKQKKGKKKLKERGRIKIPPAIYLKMLRD